MIYDHDEEDRDDDTGDYDLGPETDGAGEEYPPATPAPRAEDDRPGEPPAADPPSETPAPADEFNPPTEELFAFEARVEEGDVPDLDPVFRAALLESAESAIPETPDETPPPAAEPPTGTEESAVPATGDFEATGEYPLTGEHSPTGEYPATGEEPLTGEEPATGTQEWDPPTETGITAEQTAVLQATARSQVHDAIEFSRRTGRAWDPPRPPRGGDFDEPAKRPRYWWRFLLAILIITGSFATATQASVMNFVNGVTEQIGGPDNKINLPDKLLPDAEGPQTIAIIGSDVRTGGGSPTDDPGRSDTTMLVRLDPDSGQIAMLSIPRDLRVEIPGHGTDKFNAAYSYGGVKLTIQTIKELTGLEINQVLNVDFQGFADVIDAIGCVYVDVDRDYFNDNSTVSYEEQYATIDIDAGYQKLCGYDALDFARYRHTDTDLVRAARQQDLIGEVRNRLSITEVLKRNKELLKAFTSNVDSTLDNSDQVFQLLSLLFDSRGAAVTEVSFPQNFSMIGGVSYVEASPEEIQTVVDQFLGFEDAEGPVGSLDEGEGANGKGLTKAERRAKKKAAKDREKAIQESTSNIPSKEEDGLVDAADSGLSLASTLDEEITRTDFPVFYAKRLPADAIYEDGSRVYHTRDPDKNVYGAYRMVMSVFRDGGTNYFGLQGLRGWTDPPILEAPHDEVEMDDRKFNVYPEGDRIRLISWKDGDNVYWISNSLLLTLENQEMLGMARSTRAFTPND